MFRMTLAISLTLISLCSGAAFAQTSPSVPSGGQQPLTREQVIQFMNSFEEVAARKNFTDLSALIHRRASYRVNDGDYLGQDNIRSLMEDTWRSARRMDADRFYLTDLAVLTVDDRSATVTYTYNWEWSLAGRTYRAQGRGTRVLVMEDGRLQVAHTHLSSFPKRVP